MLAKTERRLGFAAALCLTAASFLIPGLTPGLSTRIAGNQAAPQPQVRVASAQIPGARARLFALTGKVMPKSMRYE
ncbi:MAG: hypothetical protein J0H18_04650 [Rhizobiales bacterium]|nr:hypothetical protein [Hyphomicrobiales bacterium]OJY06816.1 MAG: hypothetical protein BGP07_17535 [Rhizobiales bacterium 63-22]